MSTTYMTHNPRVGNHGLLVSEKNDTGFCEYLRERLDEGYYEDQGYTEEQMAAYRERAVDDEGYCGCKLSQLNGSTSGTGGTFSVLMSLPIRDNVEEDITRLGWNYEDSEAEQIASAQSAVDWRLRVQEVYFEHEVSLASGESYDPILSTKDWW